MKTPKVSVILPVYNGDRWLDECIKSVLNQTFQDFEFIIVNDGSTDKTPFIMDKYSSKDNRIILINKPNTGLSDTLNTGLKVSRGKYIARIDSDDICLQDRLKLQVHFLDNNLDYIIVGSSVLYINELGKFLGYSYVFISDSSIKRMMYKINPFVHPSVMIVKSVLDDVNGYEGFIRQDFEDYYLWHRLRDRGKFYNLPIPLIKYRLVDNSLSKGWTEEYSKAVKFVSIRGGIVKSEYDTIKHLKKHDLSNSLLKRKSYRFLKYKYFSYFISYLLSFLLFRFLNK